MGSALGAGTGADMLQEVLRNRYEQVFRNQQLQLQQNEFEEQRRMRELAQPQQAENAKYLNEQRAATAEKLRGEAAAKTARDQQIENFLSDPNLSPAVRQWGRGAALGFNQLSVHDYEAPEAHQAHIDADAERKTDEAFNLHTRQRDYDNAHPAPVRIRGVKPASDNPAFPLGSQRYVTQIATKHPNDLSAAEAELSAYLSDPQTQAIHPHLSPIQAFDALRRLVGTRSGGGSSDLDAMIAQAMNGGAVPTSAGQRGSVPVRVGNVPGVGARSARGSSPSVNDGQLAERAKAVLQQRGFATSPENVERFLSDPRNRHLLEAGGQ
jgi:hypothetical protein